jgi:hypothetical protein
MVDEQNEDVVIEHLDTVDCASLEPMVGAFQDAGISVRVQEEEPGAYGTMGAFAALPTVVQVIVAAGTAAGTVILHEAAKDAYGALKRGFAALWTNLHHTSDRVSYQRYSMKLSAIWKFPDGSQLKLLLSPNSQAHDAETGFAQFLDIIKLTSDATHQRSRVRAKGSGIPKLQIWVFNPSTNRLEPVDPDVE